MSKISKSVLPLQPIVSVVSFNHFQELEVCVGVLIIRTTKHLFKINSTSTNFQEFSFFAGIKKTLASIPAGIYLEFMHEYVQDFIEFLEGHIQKFIL